MKVFLRAFKNLALSCLILSVVGCASVTSSTSQVVSVNTVYKGGAISGAKCSLTNDKGSWFATTPGEATIQKSYGDLVVTCKKQNIPTGTSTFPSSATGNVFGNVLIGGGIGYFVDRSSGAGFDYPAILKVEMGMTVTVEPPKRAPQNSNTFQQ